MKRRNSPNKRKASPKKGSSPKRKQRKSVSPRRNRVSVGDRAGTSGLRNSPRRSISPETSFYPDSLNDSAFYADHSFARPRGSRDPPRRSSFGSGRSSFGAPKQSSLRKPRGSMDPSRRSSFGRRRRSSFGVPKQSSLKKYAPRRSQMFNTKGQLLQLSPIAEGQQFQMSPRAEDALNRVMASRMEAFPIISFPRGSRDSYQSNASDRTMQLAPHRSLRLSSDDSDRTMRFSPNIYSTPNSNVANRRQNILSDSVLNLRKQDSFAIRHENPDFQMEVPSLDTDPRVVHEVAMMMRDLYLQDEFDINDFANLGFSDYLLNAALQKCLTSLSESDKRRISEVQLKKKEMKRNSLINKVSKEMAVELLNNNKIVGNKYLKRGIPGDVIFEASEKASIAKKNLLAMWAKEKNDKKKSKDLYRKPFNRKEGYPGIYRSPGSTRRTAMYIKKTPDNLKEQLEYQRIVNILLKQYDQGNFNPDLPLNQQPFQIPSKYEVGPETYAKALNMFKRINALGPYNVDKTPVYSDSNYLKSVTNDITRSDVLGLRQRRLYHNGGQFSSGEVKKLQKKITDMYKDGDYEEPIVEEQPEDQHGDNFGLTKFDKDEQFETEHYGTDSDDDL